MEDVSSVITVVPSKKECRRQLDPFVFDIFSTQPDITKLSIRYSISYDGTEPGNNIELMTVKEAYNGHVTLAINGPCILSMYLVYEEFGEQKIRAFCINMEIALQPVLKSIRAAYIASVKVTDAIDVSKVSVLGILTDDTMCPIPAEACTFKNERILQEGENEVMVYYNDGEERYECIMLVSGVRKLISLRGTYIGLPKQNGDIVTKQELEVYGLYRISETETVEELVMDYGFRTIPVVTQNNHGIITIVYCNIAADVIVAGESSAKKMTAIYDGTARYVHDAFNKEDVVLTIQTGKYEFHWVSPTKCQFSSLQIKKEGWNYYTVYCYENFTKYEAVFRVYGIQQARYKDLENFVVIYDGEDVTEDFSPELYSSELAAYRFSWNGFTAACKRMNRYGMYLIYAPKDTGLYIKYASLWEIHATETQAHGTIIEIFHEREEEDNEYKNGETEPFKISHSQIT